MRPARHSLLICPALCVATLVALAAPRTEAAVRRSTAVPALDHVIVVVMENKSYDQVRTQPYTLDSLIHRGSSFANAYGITHPSQPNYLSLWAGSTLGVYDNTCPPPGVPSTAENLGHACEAAGLSWRAYSEDLPTTGSAICISSEGEALYTRKHAPWTHFANLSHANERVYADLALDIANDSLPNLAFVVPNNCNNSHNGGICSVAWADAWLRDQVPMMLSAVGPRGVVVVTWDEDDYGGDNHILTVFRGARVDSDYVSAQVINHHTVLRTICDALGLAPFGAAASENPIADIWIPEGPLDVAGPTPPGLRLGSISPNPSAGTVRVSLDVPAPAWIAVGIFDAAGRRVLPLLSGVRSGRVQVEWDGRDARGRRIDPGVYWLRVESVGLRLERKFVRLD